MTKEQFYEIYRKKRGMSVPVYPHNGNGRGLMYVNDEGQIVCKYYGDYLAIKDEDFKNWELEPFDPEEE